MKYTKYLAILAAAFMMGSCSDDFLDKEPSENASEDQIKDLLDKDPTAYSSIYYRILQKYVFSGSTAKS